MAESQNNVTIRLRVPMGDMSGLRAGTQETAAWTREPATVTVGEVRYGPRTYTH